MNGPRPQNGSGRPVGASRSHRAPRGATAVIVAICLVMLCAFLALALNVGHMFSVRGELQNAADSAALAGAKDLDGTMTPITSNQSLEGAIASGTDFAERHSTDTHTDVEVTAGDVEIGFWDVATRTFTAYSTPSVTPELASCQTLPCINAVRARSYRDPTHSGSVPVAFGAMLGRATNEVRAEAVAVTGGPCGMKCLGLPIVLPTGDAPTCGIERYLSPECTGGSYTVAFTPDTTDTGAWADLGSGAATAKCLLRNPSDDCTSTADCKVDQDMAVATDLSVINGSITSACQLVAALYAANPARKYVIPIVTALCDEKWVTTGKFQFPIAKFATVQITRPPDCSGSDKSFDVTILCDQVTFQASSGGCAAAGTWVDPRLVK